MNNFWNNLSKSQQRSLFLGTAAILFVLFMQFIFFPFLDAEKAINLSISNNEKILKEIRQLATEYEDLKQQEEQVRRTLSARPKNFNLFSNLEKVAVQVGIKSNIKFMNALKGTASVSYEELPVEIRIEKITLRQLTDFLYSLESPQDLIKVKKINVVKMKESPDYLAVQIMAVTYQIVPIAGRRT